MVCIGNARTTLQHLGENCHSLLLHPQKSTASRENHDPSYLVSMNKSLYWCEILEVETFGSRGSMEAASESAPIVRATIPHTAPMLNPTSQSALLPIPSLLLLSDNG